MPGPHPARAATPLVFVALLTLLAVPLSLLPALGLAAPATAEPSAPDAAVKAGGRPVWTPVVGRPAAGTQRTVRPTTYRAYVVDAAALAVEADRGTVAVPDPTGALVTFRVDDAPVMEPALAASHPELRTWSGTSTDGTSSIRLDSTPAGVHAAVREASGSWYIDPAGRDDARTVVSYDLSALPAPQRGLVEPALPRAPRQASPGAARPARTGAAPAAGDPVQLHTYRLALLSDPTYAAAVAPNPTSNADSDARVLAAKVTLVNRLDQIYGDDLGIRLLLVNGTDTALNLWTTAETTGTNGPCGASPCFRSDQLTACQASTLDRQEWVVGQLVGARNYDIGHLAMASGAGGIAYIGGVGLEAKAGGCTGLPAPTGDAYTVDYLAHEIGHQLGADHTFDGIAGSCGGSNRYAPTAVEPGSGSTIMAYAGVCGSDDLQAHSDPVFSSVSIGEIADNRTAGPMAVREVQSVALTGFDAGDSFRLAFGGNQTSTITLGSGYSASGLASAIQAVLPPVSVIEVKPFFNEGGFDTRGFTIAYTVYASTFYGDAPQPTVVPVGGSFSSSVNDITVGNADTTVGGAVSASGNHAPGVTAPADRTIPVRTPFVLTGSGTDADGDALAYVWEQTDAGAATGRALGSQPRTSGPLFRVFGSASSTFSNAPAGTPTRSFPDLTQVLAGSTNADTGSCPAGAVDCLSEWLPTAAYAPATLDFRLLARDQATRGGGIGSDDVALTLDKTAGPFRVTSQTGVATPLPGGSAQTVTWSVNGTDKPALAPQVRILLSTDGGATYPTVLSAGTPNDGSQVVALPDLTVPAARIRVEAVGNYFYDVNDAPFAIQRDGDPTSLVVDRTGTPPTVDSQFSDPVGTAFSATSGLGTGPISASVTGLPAGVTLSAKKVVGSVASWTIAGSPSAAPGAYPVTVAVSDGSHPDQVFDSTFTVRPEDATSTYTGPAVVEGPVWSSTSVGVTVSAAVTQADDGSLGPITGATVVFRDQDDGQTLCIAPVTGTGRAGAASCSFTVDLGSAGSAVLHVEPVIGGAYAGTASPGLLTVRQPAAPDAPDPDTSITSGPTTWLLDDHATFGIAASAPTATFACRLDTTTLPCDGPSVAVSGIAPGSHRFLVSAEDEGNRDESPATRDFAVPYDDTRLKGKGWTRKKSTRAYGGTVSLARKAGATSSFKIGNIRELALLVQTGKGHGKVRVYLNGTLLSTVRTAGARKRSKLVPVASFASARNGTVSVVTTSARPVRVDGLGVSSAGF